MFTEQLPDLLDYINNLPGIVCFVGYMNIHFDNLLLSITKQTLTTLSLHNLVHVINRHTHKCGHIVDWLVRPDDDIHKNQLLRTHMSQTIIALNPILAFQSLNHILCIGLLGTRLTLTVHHLLQNFPAFQF